MTELAAANQRIAIDCVDMVDFPAYSRAAHKLGGRGALIAALVLLTYPTVGPRADVVYKSVDAEGHVVYSDRPDASESAAQKAVVEVDRPDAAEVARLAKEQEILKAEDLQRKQRDEARQAMTAACGT